MGTALVLGDDVIFNVTGGIIASYHDYKQTRKLHWSSILPMLPFNMYSRTDKITRDSKRLKCSN